MEFRPVLSKVIFVYVFCVILVAFGVHGYFSSPNKFGPSSDANSSQQNCFCELKGSINDCGCNVDTVDHFNNVKIYPRLQSLLVKNFFRYFQVNLKKECPFWVDDSKCAMKYCHVESCEEGDIPDGIRAASGDHPTETPSFKYKESSQSTTACTDDDHLIQELSYLNTSISTRAQEEFEKWQEYDEADENFCILDNSRDGAEYVDLLLNPERFTGYKGESAHRIWKNIYLENCFDTDTVNLRSFLPPAVDLDKVCYEQRAFFRIISGLHSSINIHLCSKYLLDDNSLLLGKKGGNWGHNVEEFKRRFGPESTDGQGPQWLKNLYFIYLVELRALAKAAPYLEDEMFFTGETEEDEEVRMAVKDLLSVVKSFPSHFNESLMFSSKLGAINLKQDFREKFRNISRIMDCVGCDKCRLWGKLQTQGLGTALKILFSEKINVYTVPAKYVERQHFKLSRTEIVSLFNAFGRLSNSIRELENFREFIS